MKTSDEIIDALGGTVAVSKITGLTTGRISQMRKNGVPYSWKRAFIAEYPSMFTSADLFEEPPTEARKAA